MSLINIPHLAADVINPHNLIDDVAAVLNDHQAFELMPAKWSTGIPAVSAAFTIAYSEKYLFVKYYVTEPTVKATYYRPNEPVYKDSCVELFIAFTNDDNYYNLEFNCAGTCLGQYGNTRTGREFLPANLLRQIKHLTALRNVPNKGIAWELSLAIPLSVFKYHPLLKLSQSEARLNVFKCGDEMEQPHHLCWGQIESTEPNFHQKESFKSVWFTLSEAFSVD